MGIKHLKFRNHFFLYTILLLIIIVSIISYYRFMIKHDYIVSYNGSCDSATQKCFINCEDDACTQIDYYTKIQKYAPDLYNECGSDITNCTDSNLCLSNDRDCSINYCDKNISGNNCSSPVGANSSTATSSINI